MKSQFLRLANIPDEGQEFVFLDETFWSELLQLQESEYSFLPVDVRLSVFPQESGLFFQGRLCGKLEAPCDRCLETAQIEVDFEIEFFSGFELEDRDMFLLDTQAGIEIDISLLLWEQLVLAMPEKFLCAADCKGLCSQCGVNKNKTDCNCALDGTKKNSFAVLQSL